MGVKWSIPSIMTAHPGVAASGGVGWQFKRSITVDHTKVPVSDKTSFPILVSGTYTYLKTTGNGGNVTNANGYDIAFFSDSALTTQLKHDVDRYIASTGEVAYWVKIPTLTTATDTVIYMAYGNTAITTSQADAPNVWTNYAAVWHLGDGTTLSAVSSVNSANNGTTIGSPTADAGEIAGGGVFNGTSQGIQAPLDLSAANKITISFWLYWNAFANNDQLAFEFSANYNSTEGAFIVDPNQAGGTFNVAMRNVAGTNYSSVTFTRPSAAAWHYYNLILDRTQTGTTNQIKAFLDNTTPTLGTAGTTALTGNFANTTLNIMCRNAASLFGGGKLDEVRISTVARDVDWHTTEYNNQNSPSTFYTISNPL